MKARQFDKKFDAGEDVTAHLDLASARRPGLEQKRVNVDLPLWMIRELDQEARRLGVPRQSLIKMLIARHLDASEICERNRRLASFMTLRQQAVGIRESVGADQKSHADGSVMRSLVQRINSMS